jgi:hypothetical protein
MQPAQLCGSQIADAASVVRDDLSQAARTHGGRGPPSTVTYVKAPYGPQVAALRGVNHNSSAPSLPGVWRGSWCG